MNADLFFALEIHKARQNDLMREVEECRLGRRLRRGSAGRAVGVNGRFRKTLAWILQAGSVAQDPRTGAQEI